MEIGAPGFVSLLCKASALADDLGQVKQFAFLAVERREILQRIRDPFDGLDALFQADHVARKVFRVVPIVCEQIHVEADDS